MLSLLQYIIVASANVRTENENLNTQMETSRWYLNRERERERERETPAANLKERYTIVTYNASVVRTGKLPLIVH